MRTITLSLLGAALLLTSCQHTRSRTAVASTEPAMGETTGGTPVITQPYGRPGTWKPL